MNIILSFFQGKGPTATSQPGDKEQKSTHVRPDPVRPRKLLLKQSEINKLIGKTERAGYTIVPLNLHFTRGKIKMEIGLAKGKKQHDKRQSLKEADWKREKQRLMKNVR